MFPPMPPYRKVSMRQYRLCAAVTFAFGWAIFSPYFVTKIAVKISCLFEDCPPAAATNLISNCINRKPNPETITKGNFTVMTNFLMAENQFDCNDYVTYTTQADIRYLHHLVQIIKRWQAPISIAVYTPSITAFPATIRFMHYLRECSNPLVKSWITFHLICETKYIPLVTPYLKDMATNVDSNSGICQENQELTKKLHSKVRRADQEYPINIARNVARQEALTHYVLASDIELYPSTDFSRRFMNLLQRRESLFKTHQKPYVFVLPLFEVSEDSWLPSTKAELSQLVSNGKADIFHRNVCPSCHNVPRFDEWIQLGKSEGNNSTLNIFHMRKRDSRYWEPIFVGTNKDPLYDERFSWEGRKDKMSHAFEMCLMDYDFFILDNAFLVHKGFKTNREELALIHASAYFAQKNEEFLAMARDELYDLRGYTPGCGAEDLHVQRMGRIGTGIELK